MITDKQVYGCFTLIIIGLLVGIGIRAKNLSEFFGVAVIVLVAIVMFVLFFVVPKLSSIWFLLLFWSVINVIGYLIRGDQQWNIKSEHASRMSTSNLLGIVLFILIVVGITLAAKFYLDGEEYVGLICFLITLFIILIGVIIRASNVGQILIMVLIGLVTLGLVWLMDDAVINGKLVVAIICSLTSLWILIALSFFVISGNYDRSTRIIAFWQWGKPLPSSEVSEVLLTDEPKVTQITTATTYIEPTQELQELIGEEPGTLTPTQSMEVSAKSVVVVVMADVEWNESGVYVDAGVNYPILTYGAAWTASPSEYPDSLSGPGGQTWYNDCSLVETGLICNLDGAPYGALIGKVGEQAFLIGDNGSFTAPATGLLWMGVNDHLGYHDDNRDGFIVKFLLYELTGLNQPTETPIPTVTASIEPTQEPETLIGDEPDLLITSGQLDKELFADELNRIWSLESEGAEQEAVRLGSMLQDTTGEEKQATSFLQAVALERSGQLGAARDAYARLVQDENSPFGISAGPRLSLLEKSLMDLKEKDEIYKELMNGPVLMGWFLGGGQWRWETSRMAAARELVVLRGDQLSFRFFQWLHDQSTFSPEHTYLFIFLSLTIIARVVTLPLTVRSAKLTFQFRRLQPELQYIQQMYSNDFLTMQQETNKLYKRHGLNVWGGCLIGLVDIALVAWALASSMTFAPQFILDGAAFGNVADVTTFSLGITIGSFVLMMPQTLITTLIQGQKGLMLAQYGCSSIGVGIVGTFIAWRLGWPAYIFIFWMLLSLFSLAILLILVSIIAVSKRR